MFSIYFYLLSFAVDGTCLQLHLFATTIRISNMKYGFSANLLIYDICVVENVSFVPKKTVSKTAHTLISN